MSGFRRHLALIVAFWLVCQTAGLLAAPLSLSCMPVAADQCNCPVGAGGTCPMHHKPVQGKQTCTICGSSDTTGEVSLAALTVGLGILAPTPGVLVVPHHSESVTTAVVSTVARAERPDAPPPRS